ncbi:hypothetical protein TWF718_008588 [Orbilia javanica]|uniref:Uncharacterized protein n=1 Tax=Orbilia javanica TaxID=47235 RepID=A0AAN8MNC3_9PEZI
MHLKYLYLAAFPFFTNAAPLGLDIVPDPLKSGPENDLKIANGGSVGPGLSALDPAEGNLRKYGITKTYANIMDLDAGLLAAVAGILSVNGKEGLIAAAGKYLTNPPPKNSKLDAANQKVLPTDIYKPTLPASEQDGVKFHNIDVVAFLPGVVDETWIVASGGKETHYGTNKACFSLSGRNLQLSADAIKARCLSKDISGENKGSPEEERKPLEEVKCPVLALAGVSRGKMFLVKPGQPNVKADKVEKIMGCWGSVPEDILAPPTPIGTKPSTSSNPNAPQPTTGAEIAAVAVVPPPKYAILKFNGVIALE